MNQIAGIRLPSSASRNRQRIQVQRRRGYQQQMSMPSWGAAIGGGALAIYGLSRRSKGGLLLATSGGLLTYAALQANRKQLKIARSSVLVNSSPAQVYQFWRRFENFPRFMHHLESVTEMGDRRSRWVAVGVAGTRIEWVAEILRERENESIAWRSIEGSDLDIEGVVEFSAAPGGRGTLVNVALTYRPPAGALGHAVARLFGKDPSFMMRQDLRRFKALFEAGEIPTVEGQTHGPRTALVAAARMADIDRPIRREARLKEVFAAKRRAS